MVILLVIYLLNVIVLILAFLLSKCFKTNQKLSKYVETKRKQLVFSPLIELILQGYFEFLVAGLLTQQMSSYDYSGEIISMCLSYFALIFTIIILPVT